MESRWEGLTRTDPMVALAIARLVWPTFIDVEGCVVLKEHYDQGSFEEWWESTGGDRQAVEAVINHVHLWDVFHGAEDADGGELDQLADLLVGTWETALGSQFPERRFDVRRDDHYGPGITATTQIT